MAKRYKRKDCLIKITSEVLEKQVENNKVKK